MPATPAWLATAEAVLNRNIDACTPAVALARRLQGKTLQIDLAGLTRVRLAAGGGRVALLAGDDSPADAVILGSPLALLALLSGASPANARSPAQVRGDAEVAAQFRELLRLARPDWEEELSRRIGDVPARRLGRLTRDAFDWARNARRTVRENLAEYLQEESRDLVNRPELDEFLHGVDALRESTDRIDARLALLERSVKGAP
ncbi:MAG: SCP2 sterol-binding domain-containing protein [Steroidobacteraceae bacterium]|jgi:ubiquinone biosynthesis protein UbiJ